MNLAIIGAGLLGRWIAHQATNDLKANVVGFYDDFNADKEFYTYPILGKINEVYQGFEHEIFNKVIIAIGYAQMNARAGYYEAIKNKIPLANVIHSTTYVDLSCKIGEGIFIAPGCVLDFDVEIADNVFMAGASNVAHHSKVGKNTFVSAGVNIAGLVNIQGNCFIGVGATIKDSITINKNSIIGAGAVVIKDTPEDSTSVGVPAKVIKAKSEAL